MSLLLSPFVVVVLNKEVCTYVLAVFVLVLASTNDGNNSAAVSSTDMGEDEEEEEKKTLFKPLLLSTLLPPKLEFLTISCLVVCVGIIVAQQVTVGYLAS